MIALAADATSLGELFGSAITFIKRDIRICLYSGLIGHRCIKALAISRVSLSDI
jgi:hypothetical protein